MATRKKPKTADAELLGSALKKLTSEELRVVVFTVGALLHDPIARTLLEGIAHCKAAKRLLKERQDHLYLMIVEFLLHGYKPLR